MPEAAWLLQVVCSRSCLGLKCPQSADYDERMEENETDPAPVAATKEPAAGAPAASRRAAVGAWLDRALLNVRVWLPALRTPDLKARQIRYRSRESRNALTWNIALPRQCWQCAATDGLTSRKFSHEIRSFESPTNILGGTLGVAGLLLLFWTFIGGTWCLRLALLIAAGGLAWLWIKSWKERLRVTLWSCGEHLEELTQPEAVSYDEDLYLFAPSEQLAEVARAELIAARKREGKHQVDAPPPKASSPRAAAAADQSAAEPEPTPRPIGVRAELPPLKLAGDEDEPSGPKKA